VEEDGFLVNGHIAALSMRAKLRGVRSSEGEPIFQRSMQDRTRWELDGGPVYFPTNGCMDASQALMFSGDWNQLVFAWRQDINWKVADQAVIQDAGGNIVYNLFQQDIVALRMTMRLGFQLPNPVNRINEDDSTRYPFSVLEPK
jgi:HK97 family phage major capsid protein